jgi:hypothetical protein
MLYNASHWVCVFMISTDPVGRWFNSPRTHARTSISCILVFVSLSSFFYTFFFFSKTTCNLVWCLLTLPLKRSWMIFQGKKREEMIIKKYAS